MITLSPSPVLTTERLTLRAPQAGDWAGFKGFFLSERSKFVRSPDMDAARAWRVFGSIIGHWVLRGWGSFVFTLKDDDTPIGSCGPWFPEGWPEPEIGWMIWSAQHTGQGYAQEAATATLGYAFDALGWNSAVSYVDATNGPSMRLAERLGASIDMDARRPEHQPDTNILVYRHPKRTAG